MEIFLVRHIQQYLSKYYKILPRDGVLHENMEFLFAIFSKFLPDLLETIRKLQH